MPETTPDVASATIARTWAGSAGSWASKATVPGGVASMRTTKPPGADALPAASIAR